jgi:MFS family permease
LLLLTVLIHAHPGFYDHDAARKLSDAVFDISSQQFSMLVAAYTFSAGASGFLAAFFRRRFDRKRVLMFAYAGIFDRDFVLRDLARLRDFAGFANCRRTLRRLIGAQVLSMVADMIPYERRAAAMG